MKKTPDQARAAQEIKDDMEKPYPMDRLLCGDVGFGKTEVAIRAAFKATQDGKQVAMLVPTTVLAEQHFETFKERLADFPVTVEVINRFRTTAEQKEILDKLKTQRIDIIIGTHRILSKDIKFKNLGLVIIDEEHRFGVAHKEHLRKLSLGVDVLTMSATPIPRTLNMSMMGIRDISLINTPPRDRKPVVTNVQPYNEKIVVDAIRRELDRKGQVFFVHNRVQTIYSVSANLRELIPDAKIAVGHGQMAGRDLEKSFLIS